MFPNTHSVAFSGHARAAGLPGTASVWAAKRGGRHGCGGPFPYANVSFRVRRPKRQRTMMSELVDARGRKYLTKLERERFLAVARAHPKPAVQTLARTLAMTGCRVSEALGLRACDVDLEANEVRIATLKRRRTHWRSIPVPEDLVQALELVHRVRRAQGSARGANRRLWSITRQTANRQVGALMRTAGIEGPQACPRGLRHSYGVAAVVAGVPLPTVAAVLGHASLTTTAIYTTAIGAEARELVSRIWT